MMMDIIWIRNNQGNFTYLLKNLDGFVHYAYCTLSSAEIVPNAPTSITNRITLVINILI